VSIRRASLVLLLVVGLTPWGGATGVAGANVPKATPQPTSRQRLYVASEALVEFRAGVRAAERGRVARNARARVVKRLPDTASAPGRSLVLVRSASLATGELIRLLRADPSVTRVSPNYWRRIDAVNPDDAGLPFQWGLIRVGAGDAWERTTGAADVVIADIDTGVDVLHPDLADTIWQNPGEVPGNLIDDDGNGYVDDLYGIDTVNHDSIPMDDYGHGTHTSGIVAAVTDNGIGVAGIAGRTSVMALKFIDHRGWGTDADAVECIDYVIHERLVDGVNVVAINASWGGFQGSLFLRNAIKSAGDAGIVFCASAGNDDEDNDEWPHYPSSFDCPTILSVAATSTTDALAWFSNYGDCTVDLAAPGDAILSTLPGGQYASWAGTSMATPFVTGAVALCAAAYPDETAQQRVDRILATVRPVEALRGACMTGGLLDVPAALGLGPVAGDTLAPVTTALVVDGAPHDVRTVVELLASDGPGGSGVAATEWRVDGGAWKTGDRVSVPAPRDVVAVRTVEYRSTDRAGNVEEARSFPVAIDTADRSDDRTPGRALPASPVAGGVSPRDPFDAYRVPLRRGESLTLDLLRPPGVSAAAALFAPGDGIGDRPLVYCTPPPDGSTSFACRAPATGTYSLVVFAMDAPTPYAFAYAVYARGVDVVPPVVSVQGYRGGWSNLPVALTLSGDDAGGSGVAATEASTDDGLSWAAAGGVTVDAPVDHSNDGVHLVLSRAVDAAGNVSPARTTRVRIDTEGPSTEAWAEGWMRLSRRGRRIAVIGFRIFDRTPLARCQLVIRSAATGKVAYRRSLGWRPTSAMTWRGEDFADYALVDERLSTGTYSVKIGGWTHDKAGNRWTSAACTGQLVVK